MRTISEIESALKTAQAKQAGLQEQLDADTERQKLEKKIDETNNEVASLIRERAIAERDATIAELNAKFDEMEKLIEKTEPAVLTKDFATKWKDFCHECAILRGRLGLSIELPDELPIKYYQSVFNPLFPKYTTKPQAIYMGKSFLQIFREYRTKFTIADSERARLSA
jgi:chromosome segregation ATPase